MTERERTNIPQQKADINTLKTKPTETIHRWIPYTSNPKIEIGLELHEHFCMCEPILLFRFCCCRFIHCVV